MTSSKKLKPAERRKLRQEADRLTRLGGYNKLKDKVAQSKNTEDEGDRCFTLGYKHYRDDICTVKSMDATPLRKVLECYKNMTRCLSEPDIFELPMDIKSVTIKGHYRKYVSKLTPDTEINEFDAGAYRGFFIDRSLKIIQMVAVDYHPEDKKQKK